MKKILPFLFLMISCSSFSQTKEDIIECLNLVFDQSEFQPAFSNDVTNGAVIIIANGREGYQRARPKTFQILGSLTQDDFYDSDHHVKVINSAELERLNLPEYAVLEIFIGGGERELKMVLSNVIFLENLKFTWNYNLQKTDDEWEIIGSSVDKRRYIVKQW